MRSIRHLVVAVVAAFLIVALAAPAGAQKKQRTLRVKGSEYAFENVPKNVKAGETRISFDNVGAEEHELSLLKLDDATTLDQVLATPNLGQDQGLAEYLAVVVAKPGTKAAAEILINLKKGKYGLIDLVEGPDGQPNHTRGMKAEFAVT